MLGLKLGVLLVLTVISFTFTSQVYADSISVTFDKSEYTTGESLSMVGQISELKMPVIAMSIYDTDGKILAANNVEIDFDGSFSKTIILDSPFYEKSGQYKVKFDYGKISKNGFFIISNQESVEKENEDIEQTTEKYTPEIVWLTTDKSQYTDNDTITITGSVSTKDSPTVLIGIYDTFDAPAGFYFGNINSDLEFSTSFLAKADVNFKVDGTYSIKAQYTDSSKITSFEFFKEIEEPTSDEEIVIDKSDSANDTQVDESISTLDDKENSQNIEDTNESQQNVDSNQNETEITQKNNILDKNDSTTTSSTSNKNASNNKSIVKNIPQEKTDIQKKQAADSTIIKKSNSSDKKIKPEKELDKEIKKENNLTIEDIELGLILNQINLECDSSKYTDTITYYDGMGPALYRLCKFDNSLNFFDEELVKDPSNIEILTNKGSTLAKLGFYNEAIIYYDNVLKINSDFLPAINNKANALANLGQHDEAKFLYLYAIEKNPSYFTATKNLSILNNELNQQKIHLTEKQFYNQKPNDYSSNNKIKIIENSQILKPKMENSSNFFDEVSMAFSSLGSLFGFFN